jgi:hypothetical protein
MKAFTEMEEYNKQLMPQMKVSASFALWYKYGAFIRAFVNLAG